MDVIEIKDRNGVTYKGYKGDSNQCYEVWRMPDGAYKHVVISTFDAHKQMDHRPHPFPVGAARCASCHTEPTLSEPGWNMHTGAEIGIDEFQASRAPDKRYRTTPLRGLWTHQKGGFYHDGRFATLMDVMNHYDTTFTLGLTSGQKNDVIEYLKSL